VSILCCCLQSFSSLSCDGICIYHVLKSMFVDLYSFSQFEAFFLSAATY